MNSNGINKHKYSPHEERYNVVPVSLIGSIFEIEYSFVSLFSLP